MYVFIASVCAYVCTYVCVYIYDIYMYICLSVCVCARSRRGWAFPTGLSLNEVAGSLAHALSTFHGVAQCLLARDVFWHVVFGV